MHIQLCIQLNYQFEEHQHACDIIKIHQLNIGTQISFNSIFACIALRCVTISSEEILNEGGDQCLHFDDCLPLSSCGHIR